MSRLLRPHKEPLIHPDSIAQMKGRGGYWAAYQNHAMDSSALGHLRFLRVGLGCTFITPPKTYPDTQFGTGWAYVYVGMVDLEKEDIIEEVA
jgi:hypothetical protein